MKYAPLIWAALWRNPAELLLTVLAMSVAFTLFGTMVPVNAAYTRVLDSVRMDRLYVYCGYHCASLPVAYRSQMARIAGVTGIGYMVWFNGYHQERTRTLRLAMVDGGTQQAWSELSLNAADWKALQDHPTGLFFSRKAAALWHVTKGDQFPVVVEPSNRADGNTAWLFTVLGVFDDSPESQSGQAPDLVLGSYRYLSESQPAADRGKNGFFRLAVDREEHARGICQKIQALFATSSTPVGCVPVRDDAGQLMSSGTNLRYLSLGAAGAGLFMILFLCGSGIAESVRERLPQLAVLQTCGFTDRAVALLVSAEAAAPAVVGAVIGTGCAWVIGRWISQQAATVFRGIPGPTVTLWVFGSAVGAGLAIALVSSVGPLRRIRRMDVATVLAGL
jgi:putative ABC transport system permease protein